MHIRTLLLALILLLTAPAYGQDLPGDSLSHRHFVSMQMGGQTLVSMHYEYAMICRAHFLLNTNLGLGLNEYADDTDPADSPIYGIHSGLIALAGKRPYFFELGLQPTTYFYGPTTFVNVNNWIGLRYIANKLPGVFVAAGYTPRLYTSYSDPKNKLVNAWIGVKAGVNF